MARRVHRILPEAASGYPLEPARAGWFSVLMPAERTNLDTNPSFETSTNGASNASATIARTTDKQRRGAYSLRVTPTGASAYIRKAYTLTAATFYSFSLDLWAEAGRPYDVYIMDGSGNRVTAFGIKRVTGDGHWRRYAISGVAPASTTYYFTVQIASTNTRPFYVDGYLAEAGEASTYFDGDSTGFIVGQVAYYWTGQPHASQSFRSGQTRSGGVPVKLKDLGFTLLAIIGLGHGPIRNVATPLGYLDGALYQRSARDPLNFTLVGALEDSDLRPLHETRSALIEAFDPDLIGSQQPLMLQYQYSDDCGDLAGETFNLTCNYVSGLECNLTNLYQERVALQFQMFIPLIRNDGSAAASLDPADALSATALVIREDGIWSALGGTGFVPNGVQAIAPDYEHGRIYIGGTFTTINGVTVNGVGYLDLATGTYNAMGSGTVGVGGANPYVLALAADPAGNVWVGGQFTSVGGSAGRLARYNAATNTWTVLNPAVTTYTNVRALALDQNGNLWGGGFFTGWDGDGDQDYIWFYDVNAGTFASLGTGMDGVVHTIIPTDYFGTGLLVVYVSGEFTTGNAKTLNRIGLWSPSAADFSEIAGSEVVGLNGTVSEIALDPITHEIHAIGNFTDSHVSEHYAVHNGQTSFGQWRRGYASGITMPAPTALAFIPGEGAYLGFATTTGIEVGSGGVTAADQMVLISEVGGYPVAIFNETATSFSIQVIAGPGPNGEIFVGGAANIVIDVPGFTSLTNIGKVKAYPRIRIDGPGILRWIRNRTTGAMIRFSDYVIQSGERVALTVKSTGTSFVSSYQGNIYNAIMPISDTDRFYLQPGVNVIELFVSGATPALALIEWIPTYAGIDGAHAR